MLHEICRLAFGFFERLGGEKVHGAVEFHRHGVLVGLPPKPRDEGTDGVEVLRT
jgi:hypothetical protein